MIKPGLILLQETEKESNSGKDSIGLKEVLLMTGWLILLSHI